MTPYRSLPSPDIQEEEKKAMWPVEEEEEEEEEEEDKGARKRWRNRREDESEKEKDIESRVGLGGAGNLSVDGSQRNMKM